MVRTTGIICAPYAGITRVRFDGYDLRLGRADRTTPEYRVHDSAGSAVCKGVAGTVFGGSPRRVAGQREGGGAGPDAVDADSAAHGDAAGAGGAMGRGRPKPPSQPGSAPKVDYEPITPPSDLGDRHHCRARRHARAEVRPAGRRLLEGRPLLVARMLDRHEQGLVVRREARSAQLGATGCAEEVPGQGAAAADRVGPPHAVGEASRGGSAVGGDPETSQVVECTVVGARQPPVLRHLAVVLGAILRLPADRPPAGGCSIGTSGQHGRRRRRCPAAPAR